MTANPPWDEDERLLALELYLRRGMASKRDPEVVHLSEVLNRRASLLGVVGDEQFRNPAGVALKLANFAALDQAYDGVGMSRFSVGDKTVWDRYSGDSDEVSRIVDEIVAGHRLGSSGPTPLLDLEDDSTEDYWVSVDQAVRLAGRREARLVQRFGSYLESLGHRVGTRHHDIEGGRLRIDLLNETEGTIWEAKSEVGRNAIRLAIGQLADYRRFEPLDRGIGVLLARRPSDDLMALCASVGAAVAWPRADSPPFEVVAVT